MTDYVNIEPDFSSDYDFKGKRFIEGYNVFNRISITLSNLAQFEGLLCRLLESGINYVYQIQFRTTKLGEYREKARALALSAAKEKAVKMAAELGQKVGRPQTISEIQPDRNWLHQDQYSFRNVVVDAGGGGGAGTETFAPGQIAVKETVAVSFELE